MIGTPDDAAEAVAKDPTLRAVLRAARAWGLRPSELLHDHADTAYRIERDDTGRATRLVAPPLPVEDRLLMVALEAYEADTCGGCGQQMSVSTDPTREFDWKVGQRVRCYACTMIGIYADSLDDTVKQRHALRFPIALIDRR